MSKFQKVEFPRHGKSKSSRYDWHLFADGDARLIPKQHFPPGGESAVRRMGYMAAAAREMKCRTAMTDDGLVVQFYKPQD